MRILPDVGPNGRVLGVDLAPELLAPARQKFAAAGLTHVEFREGDAERLDVADQSFDMLVSARPAAWPRLRACTTRRSSYVSATALKFSTTRRFGSSGTLVSVMRFRLLPVQGLITEVF